MVVTSMSKRSGRLSIAALLGCALSFQAPLPLMRNKPNR